MEAMLKGYPVITEIPVAWGEMDALNHVNNVVYFRYFETARIDYFLQLSLMDDLQKTGIGPVLKETQCSYKIPVTFPDTLHVGSKICDMGDDRFTMQYSIYSQKLGKITTTGYAKVVMFNFQTNKKTLISDEIRVRVAEIQAKSNAILV
ncbi:acyl-CoA thioesterase [Photobacterium sanguinicancri]|uniref:Thioesterase n=1 Tax=Photobacterium sanguinicancri TaxID=875932 RepID=A0AAW7Y208_9GAMM|nr:thioesterase family protein [Photobacterium sanguinicancri]MDO6498391.1 thioesterase family protein [Photobacterium sanguinicancri]MDO6541469.1 thioesterase family protein [Photobacterium sanguinicancri]OZS44362.1 thioesterase [Photobacterium sanguinicancri]